LIPTQKSNVNQYEHHLHLVKVTVLLT